VFENSLRIAVEKLSPSCNPFEQACLDLLILSRRSLSWAPHSDLCKKIALRADWLIVHSESPRFDASLRLSCLHHLQNLAGQLRAAAVSQR